VQVGSPPDPRLNHLVLHVRDLPSDDHPEGSWWVDVGLGGDGFHRPLPLRAGRHDDAPYTVALRPSPIYEGGWRVEQEPAGAWGMVDVATVPPAPADLEAAHEWLSQWPESGFVKTTTVQRRDPTGAVDILRACTLSRIDATGATRETVIDAEDDWFAAVVDVFDLGLDDITPIERRALWERVRAQHEAWVTG
jgi:arylamine N-acetyltransferase